MMNMQKQTTSIGPRIRAAREEFGKSQLELAREVGFESATAISLIESSARGVAAETLILIARALKVDVKQLLGQKADPTDVIVALRADKDLDQAAKDYVTRFIEDAKKRHRKG